jgi:ribosomal protein S18 acetylase RimI-like enzyme
LLNIINEEGEITDDFAVARSWSQEILGSTLFVDTWFPAEKFLYGLRNGAGFSLTRIDDPNFTVAFGTAPPVTAENLEISMELQGLASIKYPYQVEAYWEQHSIEIEMERTLVIGDFGMATHEEIRHFLDINAPEASVKPGNQEIQRWVVMREADQIVGVAALCLWESGKYVVASVATDKRKRGLGIGERVMQQVLFEAKEIGVKELSLGVLSENLSAIRLYQKIGFRREHQFAHIKRIFLP